MLIFSAAVIVAVILDIITKYYAVAVFKVNEIEIIKDVLYFTYVENRGAAFGILENQRWFFLIITILIIAVVVGYIFIKKPKNRLLLLSLGMIAGGGAGNFIDRARLSYVVDFIDVRIINYPVFNVADCFVVVGAVLFGIYILFYEGKSGNN